MFGLEKEMTKERRDQVTAIIGLITVTVLTVVGFQLQAQKEGRSTTVHSADFQASVLEAIR